MAKDDKTPDVFTQMKQHQTEEENPEDFEGMGYEAGRLSNEEVSNFQSDLPSEVTQVSDADLQDELNSMMTILYGELPDKVKLVDGMEPQVKQMIKDGMTMEQIIEQVKELANKTLAPVVKPKVDKNRTEQIKNVRPTEGYELY